MVAFAEVDDAESVAAWASEVEREGRSVASVEVLAADAATINSAAESNESCGNIILRGGN